MSFLNSLWKNSFLKLRSFSDPIRAQAEAAVHIRPDQGAVHIRETDEIEEVT